MTTRAVIYIRLSQHAGADDPSTSPERQRQACLDYCAQRDWEVVEVVEDLDVSGYVHGKRLSRPGLKRVIKLMPSVDRIVFLKVDRLARSVRDFQDLVELADKHGAALVSVKDGLDFATPMGRALAALLSVFAELESATISERVTDTYRHMRAVGRWAGQRVPYGYKKVENPNGPGYVIEVDQEAADDIRQAAIDLINGSTTLFGIARRWSVERNVKVNTDQVKRTLFGDIPAGKTIWPGIYDAALLGRLTVAMKEREGAVRQPGETRLLARILKCPSCESSLGATSTKNKAGRVGVYACGKPWCTGRVAVVQQSAEDLVGEWFLAEFGDLRRLNRVRQEADDLTERQAAIKAAMQDVANDMVGGGDIAVLSERLTRLREELATAQSAPRVVNYVEVLDKASYRQRWEQSNVLERREMLLSLVDKIILKPAGRKGRVSVSLDRFDIRLHEDLKVERDEDGRAFMITDAYGNQTMRWKSAPHSDDDQQPLT